MFTVTHVDSATISTTAAMDIMAKNQQEATKLYGLVLRHKGFLKPLGGLPYEVTLMECHYESDRRGQTYKMWDNKDKIYVEFVKLCLFLAAIFLFFLLYFIYSIHWLYKYFYQILVL